VSGTIGILGFALYVLPIVRKLGAEIGAQLLRWKCVQAIDGLRLDRAQCTVAQGVDSGKDPPRIGCGLTADSIAPGGVEMGMASQLRDLRAMSDEQIIALHDADAKSTVVGVNYFLEELARREARRNANAVQQDTSTMKWLTIAITVMTLVNTAFVAWSALR
jgi:hypothetical protein